MTAFRLGFAGLLAVFGALCIAAGGFEVLSKRRPPGKLFGRGLFPRNGPQRSDNWTPEEWRQGGFIVGSLGIVLFAVGLALVVTT